MLWVMAYFMHPRTVPETFIDSTSIRELQSR
jgi:hypothetical protein